MGQSPFVIQIEFIVVETLKTKPLERTRGGTDVIKLFDQRIDHLKRTLRIVRRKCTRNLEQRPHLLLILRLWRRRQHSSRLLEQTQSRRALLPWTNLPGELHQLSGPLARRTQSTNIFQRLFNFSARHRVIDLLLLDRSQSLRSLIWVTDVLVENLLGTSQVAVNTFTRREHDVQLFAKFRRRLVDRLKCSLHRIVCDRVLILLVLVQILITVGAGNLCLFLLQRCSAATHNFVEFVAQCLESSHDGP